MKPAGAVSPLFTIVEGNSTGKTRSVEKQIHFSYEILILIVCHRNLPLPPAARTFSPVEGKKTV